ncbi:nucleotidyl transferase AbiEii/AbiGii toxin family protein [Patescibacteria group bacterium]|nr:nucleotidyl transferase AbiEii/AbiGii toxin family protein [Patescibacteria group bacterium]MBU1952846.1 nucleotidyl transferase AbiEii/AbiGii toxin family protein [Patescibacteria group bacterium]
MTLDISLHKTILFQILKDIYSDTTISPFLGFKGGTAALMFYKLDRFSVDLDFDLLDESKEDEVFAKVLKIAAKYGTIKESYKKRYNLFCLISYEDKARNIKVEINRRQFGSKYEMKTYLGISMLTMVSEDMFAHKLMAMYERMGKTSRDIYDVWFFLSNRFPINKEIVEKRSNMPFKQLIQTCILQLEKINNNRILEGLGELLTPNQKDWAKAKLKEETIALLKLRIEAEK